MSERKDYDIVGSYDNQRVLPLNAERTVNLFEYLDPQAKRPKALLSTSGLRNANLDFSAETGGARAAFVFDGAIYWVFGASIFRTTGTTNALVTTDISPPGGLTTSQGYVGVDANQYQVIFVDGVLGYIYDINIGGTVTQITDVAFPPAPVDVCYLDGFFVVPHGGTNQFQLSSFNQGMVWSGVGTNFTASAATDILTLSTTTASFATGVPITFDAGILPSPLIAGPPQTYYVIRVTDPSINPGQIKVALTYADAIAGIAIDLTTNGTPPNAVRVDGQVQQGEVTSHPGTIVGCRTLHRRLFFFCENFTEVWENAGIGTNLPFRRNNSLLMEVGTPALGSITVGFDRMFFLAQDKDGLAGVMGVSGTQSVLFSNRALDFQLAQYAEDPNLGVEDARGVLIKENGLIFYRLNFTNANHTFVLGVSMSAPDAPKWHEEEVLNGDRHPAQTHAYFDGVNYYGSYKAAVVYSVDDTLASNDGEAIRRMRIGRQMTPEGYNRLRVDRFQLDLLQGALVTGELGFTPNTDVITPYAPNAQPTVFLSISKDGGQTYGNKLHATMGKIGERTHRTVWRKLGTTPRGQGFVPRIEFFHEIPFQILGAAWDFETLPE